MKLNTKGERNEKEIERITVVTNQTDKNWRKKENKTIYTPTKKKRRNKKEDKVSKYTN